VVTFTEVSPGHMDPHSFGPGSGLGAAFLVEGPMTSSVGSHAIGPASSTVTIIVMRPAAPSLGPLPRPSLQMVLDICRWVVAPPLHIGGP
jgi:hypothetical protein